MKIIKVYEAGETDGYTHSYSGLYKTYQLAAHASGFWCKDGDVDRDNLYSVVARRAFVEEFSVTSVALAMGEAIQNSGMSQREVAERLGVSEARISQILSATGNPTIKTLARLADVLGRELRVEFSVDAQYSVEPRERDAVELDDGTVWLLDGKPVHFTDVFESKRAAALAKLTPEERKILGV